MIWRDDILRTWLDPKQPFQTDKPPQAPDYEQSGAWAILPRSPALWSIADPPADVFFVHPTSFDGGAYWNGPITDRLANRFLSEVVLPNYAGPFRRVGRVFAPRYRQASLYAFMTNKEDAQSARVFALSDVRRAFEVFLRQYNDGRPLILVGVEQGGSLVGELAREAIQADPQLRRRLAAVYLVETITPALDHTPGSALPACAGADQTGCVLAWKSAEDPIEAAYLAKRALVWASPASLEDLGSRRPLCVNPLLGAVGDAEAPVRMDLGAANATGLEWGVRPAFLPRQVSAACQAGFLRVSRPASPSLRRSGGWSARFKVAPFNLFFVNEETDAARRVSALRSRPGYQAPSPSLSADPIAIRPAPIHAIPHGG